MFEVLLKNGEDFRYPEVRVGAAGELNCHAEDGFGICTIPEAIFAPGTWVSVQNVDGS